MESICTIRYWIIFVLCRRSIRIHSACAIILYACCTKTKHIRCGWGLIHMEQPCTTAVSENSITSIQIATTQKDCYQIPFSVSPKNRKNVFGLEPLVRDLQFTIANKKPLRILTASKTIRTTIFFVSKKQLIKYGLVPGVGDWVATISVKAIFPNVRSIPKIPTSPITTSWILHPIARDIYGSPHCADSIISIRKTIRSGTGPRMRDCRTMYCIVCISIVKTACGSEAMVVDWQCSIRRMECSNTGSKAGKIVLPTTRCTA